MKTNVGTLKNLLDKKKSFLKKTYSVKSIGVFGSVAANQATKISDIDLLVEFSRPLGFFKFIELEEYLGKILGRKVDLVTKKALKSTIKDEVLKNVIYV